jgi:N-acetylmuramoyl-L-alanine amidase
MAKVSKVRAWKSPDKTRVVFEITAKADYKIFQLGKPERLIIDLKNISISQSVLKKLSQSSLIVSSRSSKQKNNTYRIVFELKKSVKYKVFQLKPAQGYSHRLVIDLFPVSSQTKKKIVKPNKPKTTGKVSTKTITKVSTKTTTKGSSKKAIKTQKTVKYLRQRDLVVAIDAGHGGEDPGAAGRRGTKEKHIVLAIAKKLARKVNAQKGMKAILIRKGDYYISLRGRTKIARKANADVFISIHADAFRNSKAKGSSVFILSQRGATSETARWLANKENSADMAGGVSIDDKDDLLAKVLLDLSTTASIEGSNSVAKKVLSGLGKIGKLHKKTVERAGFVVLKSPDMPSILVETGFISNPYEESQLRKSSYQQKIANAIFSGINNYFKRYPIPGTIYGQHIVLKKVAKHEKAKASRYKKRTRTHKVVRGDNLSLLAKRYGLSVKELKRANRMRSNTLVLGKKLIIPQ